MADISSRDAYAQCKTALSFLKFVLRIEDSNLFVAEIAKNIQVFRTIESLLFYDAFIIANTKDNPIVRCFLSEIRVCASSLLYLIVTGERPASVSKGESSTKCLFNEKGSHDHASIQKHLKETLDLFSLAVFCKGQLGVRKSEEVDLRPEHFRRVGQLVKFLANPQKVDQFGKLWLHFDRLIQEEESANHINSTQVYFSNNASKFERSVGALTELFELCNFVLVHNQDMLKAFIESPFFVSFVWKSYFYSVEMEESLKPLLTNAILCDEAKKEAFNDIVERHKGLRDLIVVYVDNVFEAMASLNVFSNEWTEKNQMLKWRHFEKLLPDCFYPFFTGLFKRVQQEQVFKSLFKVQLKYIVRNCPNMRSFLRFIVKNQNDCVSLCPEVELLLKFHKEPGQPKALGKTEPSRKKQSESMNAIEELAQVSQSKQKSDNQKGLVELSSVIEKIQHKRHDDHLFVGLDSNDIYEDEYDDTFDAKTYTPNEQNGESENEMEGEGQEDDGGQKGLPGQGQGLRRDLWKPSSTAHPGNQNDRRDKFRKNKRDFHQKERNNRKDKGGGGGGEYVRK